MQEPSENPVHIRSWHIVQSWHYLCIVSFVADGIRHSGLIDFTTCTRRFYGGSMNCPCAHRAEGTRFSHASVNVIHVKPDERSSPILGSCCTREKSANICRLHGGAGAAEQSGEYHFPRHMRWQDIRSRRVADFHHAHSSTRSFVSCGNRRYICSPHFTANYRMDTTTSPEALCSCFRAPTPTPRSLSLL